MRGRTGKRPTGLCVLARRLGVTGDETSHVPWWWGQVLNRHEASCPHCRAEREETAWVRRRLQTLAKPTAPAGVLDAVMARIAAERDSGCEVVASSAAKRSGAPGRGTKAGWYSPGRAGAWAAGLVICSVGVAAAGWLLTRAAAPAVWALIIQMGAVTFGVFQAVHGVAEAVGVAGQILLAALWAVAGWSVTVAVQALDEAKSI